MTNTIFSYSKLQLQILNRISLTFYQVKYYTRINLVTNNADALTKPYNIDTELSIVDGHELCAKKTSKGFCICCHHV